VPDRDPRRLRVWVGVVSLLLALGFAMAGLPLLEAPGYEAGMAAALLAALAGAPLTIASWRRELGLPAPNALRAFARAALAIVVLQAALLGGAALRTALLSPCGVAPGLPFLPVLALPSALLAAALGVLAGVAAGGRPLPSALLYLAAAALSLALSLLEAWRGPAAYVADPLLGYWPGPLYDEALSVDHRLALFRLGTLAWAAALAAAAVALSRWKSGPGRSRAVPALALLLSVAVALALRGVALRTGDIASRAAIDRALGGRREGRLCDLHYPSEKPALETERLLRGCETDLGEVARLLGIERPPRVAVWLYRSEAEKRRLVGAGRTDFTKPWIPEVHVLDAPGGPASLRHELVHAVAGAAARGPLRVPATLGVWVNAGLVEGLAVALDLPRGEWTVHEWARAMRMEGLLPSARSLVEPAGFFSAPPARAYAASGSLLRFLLERYGAAPVRRAYGGASFEEAFAKPLAALEAEWLLFLDGVAVPPELASAAEARFAPKGLLGRHCAREVAGLEQGGAEAEREGLAERAARAYRRAALLSGDPVDLARAGDALRLADPALAERTYSEALRGADGRPALRASLLQSLGDLSFRAGDPAGAASLYERAQAEHPDRPAARLLAAKLAAARDPALAAAAGPWLLGEGDSGLALSRLATSDGALAAYLLGRASLSRGAPRLASSLLARALRGSLPSPAFRAEALRALGEARCASGDDGGARAAFAELETTAEREADRELARALERRCEDERRLFGPPPPSPSDWPP